MINVLKEGSPNADNTRINALENQLLDSYEVQAELYETIINLKEQNLNTLGALAEVYEMLLGGDGS